VVLIVPEKMSKVARIRLQWELVAFSKRSQLMSGGGQLAVHTYSFPDHIPPPHNSLLNLARFFAPSSSNRRAPVLLAPSLSIVADLSVRRQVLDEGVAALLNGTIPVLFLVQKPSSDTSAPIGPPKPDATPSAPRIVGSSGRDVTLEPSSSTILLVDKDGGPWCPERFLSRRTKQWTECLWHAWLLSRGAFRLVEYEVDNVSRNQTDADYTNTDVEKLVSFTE
jgi:hypothetical protein